MSKGPPVEQPAAHTEEITSDGRAEIVRWLKKLKFSRKLFGGVDERTVWKRIGELDALYARLLEDERVRYDALLEEYKLSASRQIRALEEKLRARGGDSGG